MSKVLTLFSAFMFLFTFTVTAQTAEEIVENYLETIGGKDKLAAITNSKSTCTAKAQGMELPIVMYQKAPGAQRMDMTFQGKKITQMCFDGKEGWSTNFMTMEAEKWDAQDSNVMAAEMSFPSPFIGYADRGHTLTLEGEEEIEGTACHKIKLTRKPVMIDEKEVENVSYYFFDKETGVILMERSFGKTGEMKGIAMDTFMSDYDEVEGLYFPLTMTQKMNGQTVFNVSIDKMELNTEMADELFALPAKAEVTEGK